MPLLRSKTNDICLQRGKRDHNFLIVLFHVQLDFLSQPESHMLARPQRCSKAEVASLSEMKERMMSSLAVKD